MAQQPGLGDRIREARASKGWKQRELASQVEVEPITVSRWERGATTPDLDVLRLVAEATDKPLSYFVAGEDERPQAADTDDAIRKLERAADRLGEEADRIAKLLDEVRAELARLR
ncbi:MAG: helix-turn-helix domain-containing protein [Actinomycetota bacterium]|nr:helix-turn-helix domain-containing protein [Actinomycetota bacterium]